MSVHIVHFEPLSIFTVLLHINIFVIDPTVLLELFFT